VLARPAVSVLMARIARLAAAMITRPLRITGTTPLSSPDDPAGQWFS
jgi:hypothetical protein